ncbi:MAG: glycosyltransferase family 4 protein [Proteobacteria bacterium]|nr:glycosyltransferase family 4 protein [Pseudomonadota bacterium]
MKPKIIVIVDVPGWALERTADNVMACLSDRYDFEKAFNENAVEKIREGKFDLLYITYETQFQDAGIEVAIPERAVTGVRCHFKWDGGGKGMPPSAAFLSHLRKFSALNVPSGILCNIFKPLHPAVFYTPHGVDIHRFKPKAGGPYTSPEGELILGWAGSLTNHPGKRGVEDYIMPAIKGLKGVSLRLAAREEKWRTQGEMAAFYQGLDAQICASRTEGGPHPLLEAAACGIPLISTRVGLAPELIREGENGFLVERDIEALREAIIKLRDNRELRLSMGKRARAIIEESWHWGIQAQHYIPFFNHGLNTR